MAIRPSLLSEGEVPCCGKRSQSQLRENKKNVNTGLIKDGRPATPPQAVAGGRSLLGRVVTSTAALFFVRVVSYHEPLALRLCTAVHKSCGVKVWVNVERTKICQNRHCDPMKGPPIKS
jgi:hypothetical protein